jgi:hypothetical protein
VDGLAERGAHPVPVWLPVPVRFQLHRRRQGRPDRRHVPLGRRRRARPPGVRLRGLAQHAELELHARQGGRADAGRDRGLLGRASRHPSYRARLRPRWGGGGQGARGHEDPDPRRDRVDGRHRSRPPGLVGDVEDGERRQPGKRQFQRQHERLHDGLPRPLRIAQLRRGEHRGGGRHHRRRGVGATSPSASRPRRRR